MVEESQHVLLVEQTLAIARDPSLREAVYERIGEYCHSCRNRLNSLKLSLYLARQQAPAGPAAGWSSIDALYGDLEAKLEIVQRLCRPLTLCRVKIPLDLLMEDRRSAWTETWARRQDSLRFLAPPEPPVVSVDVDRVGHALDALIAWRAEQGGQPVEASIGWELQSEDVRIFWEESIPIGKGPESEDRRWSLPWLIRVIAEHGGSSEIQEDARGWRMDLRWPSLPPAG